MNIQIMLNEAVYTFPAGITLAQVISQLHLPEQGCVFALNEQVMTKSRWSQVMLNDGDQISLFQVIAGG
ncbi:sulfur carrier protein ThiS [Vibrio gazogenes]|nr:sulfur carrier protein ThiS [Vibrio gazogenes]ASA55761.1 thiamine biosynthesis protein ThiS [Vibrio gazogenes]USP13738.1 sulfur carrier protein ThiS [Vibrio gazogenes]